MDINNTREEKRKLQEEIRSRYWGHSGSGRIWTGVFLLIIGTVALLKAMLFPIPAWVYTWQMLLIALGFFLAIRHNFRGGLWFVLMLIGGVFLIDEFFPEVMMRQYLWPAAFILAGLFFIFKPRRRNWQWREQKEYKGNEVNLPADNENALSEDVVDATSIFGGIKKNILSKNFKGGDIVNIMGGSEINLTQADINGTVRLELTQVFGGTKLVVPSNWQVRTEMAAIFGGVEDKRSMQNMTFDPNKILVLAGTSIFGGIEIRSY